MHSAVWSQPTGTSGKFRANSGPSEVPDSKAGKFVLGVSITLILIGGLLIVLGLTGFFVKDHNKMLLGFATVAGAVSIVTGTSGCRAVSGWDRAKACTNMFTILTLVDALTCSVLTAMAAFILFTAPTLLLTTVIAIGEVTLGCVGLLLASSGLIVALSARAVLRNPLGAETARNRRKKRQEQDNLQSS